MIGGLLWKIQVAAEMPLSECMSIPRLPAPRVGQYFVITAVVVMTPILVQLSAIAPITAPNAGAKFPNKTGNLSGKTKGRLSSFEDDGFFYL